VRAKNGCDGGVTGRTGIWGPIADLIASDGGEAEGLGEEREGDNEQFGKGNHDPTHFSNLLAAATSIAILGDSRQTGKALIVVF
jgi:hypothetical protein